MKKKCKVENCDSPSRRYGMCNMHGLRFVNHGDPLFLVRPKIAQPHCNSASCDRPHYGKGFCKLHYTRATTGKFKEVSQCKQCDAQLKKADAKFCSLSCDRKWNRKHGYLQDGLTAERRGLCSVKDCKRAKQSNGMCGPHRTALVKYGDPLFSKRVIEAVNCSGCNKPLQKEVGSKPLCSACYHNAYYHENHEVERPRRNARRSRVKQATPPWVNMAEIRAIYAQCPDGHEVDHVIPIKSKTVCGLHVPWNLQYLPVRDNRRKSNRHVDEVHSIH